MLLGETFDGKQILKSGVKKGERVVVGGLQNRMMHSGATVKVVGVK